MYGLGEIILRPTAYSTTMILPLGLTNFIAYRYYWKYMKAYLLWKVNSARDIEKVNIISFDKIYMKSQFIRILT